MPKCESHSLASSRPRLQLQALADPTLELARELELDNPVHLTFLDEAQETRQERGWRMEAVGVDDLSGGQMWPGSHPSAVASGSWRSPQF